MQKHMHTLHIPPHTHISTRIHLTSLTFTVSLSTLRSPDAPLPPLPATLQKQFVVWPMPIGSTLFWRSAFITVLFPLLVRPKTTFIWFLASMSLIPCTFTPNCATIFGLALFISLRKPSLSVSCSDSRLNAFDIFSSASPKARPKATLYKREIHLPS